MTRLWIILSSLLLSISLYADPLPDCPSVPEGTVYTLTSHTPQYYQAADSYWCSTQDTEYVASQEGYRSYCDESPRRVREQYFDTGGCGSSCCMSLEYWYYDASLECPTGYYQSGDTCLEGTDTDGDGIPDETDTDDDGDGIPDTQDPDHPDYQDSDGYSDAIPDSTRCGGYPDAPLSGGNLVPLGWVDFGDFQSSHCDKDFLNKYFFDGVSQYMAFTDSHTCSPSCLGSVKSCPPAKVYSWVVESCVAQTAATDCVLDESLTKVYMDPTSQNCYEQHYCEDGTSAHQTPATCPDSDGDGQVDDDVSTQDTKDAFKQALSEVGVATEERQTEAITELSKSSQLLDDIKDKISASNEVSLKSVEQLRTSNTHLAAIEQGIADLLAQDSESISIDTSALEAKVETTNTILDDTLYTDTELPDDSSYESDRSSFLTDTVDMFTHMYSDFNTSFNNVNDAISTIEGGFETHMSKEAVTSCPRSFTFDLGEAGGLAPIDTDVCESTSRLYPLVYPVTFITASVTFISLILSMLLGL